MNRYKSNVPMKMKQYQVVLDLARDKSSTFYNSDGSQNRGASHRGHFWNGFNLGMHPVNSQGAPFTAVVPATNSMMYCVYRAGVDFKAEVTA